MGAHSKAIVGKGAKVRKTPPQDLRSNVERNNEAHGKYHAVDRRMGVVTRQVADAMDKNDREMVALGAYSKDWLALNGSASQLLYKAQESWKQFRHQECLMREAESRMGSGYGGFLTACLQEMTASRTKQLEELLHAYRPVLVKGPAN